MLLNQDFDKIKNIMTGNDLLSSSRASVLAQLKETGLPSKKDEEWKYTSLYNLSQKNYRILENDSYVSGVKPLSKWYIYLDSSRRCNLPSGCSYVDLASYINKQSHEALVINNNDKLSQLNFSLMNEGYILSIADETTLDEPIHIIIDSNNDKITRNIRNNILIGSGSKVEIIQQYIGDDELDYFNNIVTKIEIKNNAALDFLSIQEESRNSHHIENIEVSQQEHSYFNWKEIALGSNLARTYIEANLSEGADCNINGLSAIGSDQHIDHNTLINHLGPNSKSTEEFRGVYNDNSVGVFKGEIFVKSGIRNIVSKQLNKSILLSNKAKVFTQPRLAIYNNDVECAHGAAIGQIDEAGLFYLRSRGLSKEDAMAMMLDGFMQNILNGIQHQNALSHVKNRINNYLKAHA